MSLSALVLLALLAGGLVTACDEDKRHVAPTGATEANGIVVERTTLRTTEDCYGLTCLESCRLEGTVRNDTAADRRVTLAFTALDRDGKVVCQFSSCTDVVEVVVPAGGRSDFEELLLALVDCDRITRVEVTRIESAVVSLTDPGLEAASGLAA